MNWRKIFESAAFLSGGALVISLFLLLPKGRSSIYAEDVNGRSVYPFGFNTFFLILMLIGTSIIFNFLAEENPPPWTKGVIRGARRSRLLPTGKEALLVTFFCWLVCLPLNFFLWGAPFGVYTTAWAYIFAIGYFIGAPIIMIALVGLGILFDSIHSRFLLPRYVNLTDLETSEVIKVMGFPLKQIQIDNAVVSLFFRENEFKDALSLARKFLNAEDPLSDYLQRRFSILHSTQPLWAHWVENHQNTEEFRTALANDLNMLLKGPCLYDQERFKHVTLNDETKQLLEQSSKLVLLNRMLLEDAYPLEIAKRSYIVPKEIYVYKNVKVVFADGRVIDVQ